MITAEMNQAFLKGGQKFPHKRLKQILRWVQKVTGAQRYHVSIAFVSPSSIKRANRLYRKKDRVTDVLSFSLSPDQGELLLCYEQAKKQAQEMNHSAQNEVTFLIVHGILHLFGHDHERATEAKSMFLLQEKILLALGVDPRL